MNKETAIAAVERRARPLLLWLAWILVALCAFFLVYLFVSRSKTFTLNAQTEEVRLEIQDPRGTSAWLADALMREGTTGNLIDLGRVRLDLENGVRVTLARVQMGEVLIQMDWASPSQGAKLSNGRSLESGAVIHVPLGKPNDANANDATSMLLSFRGVLRVGDDVGPQVQRTLLGGNVTIIEKALFSKNRYVAGAAALDPGDFVSWRNNSAKDHPVIVSGFVHAGESEALTVVAHGDADSLEVVRYGAEAYDITPSTLSRISHDPLLADIGTGILILAALLGLFVPAKEFLELYLQGSERSKARIRAPDRLHRSGRLPAIAGISLIAAATAGPAARAQDIAYLNSLPKPGAQVTTIQGNAWLFNRGGRCYAVTPRHVLLDDLATRDDHYARIVIARVGQSALEAVGERCAVFKKYDLAVMRVSGVPRIADCGRVLTGIADEETLLARSQAASLVTAASSGRFERANVAVRQVSSNPDYFHVAVTNERDRLTEGMSGGLITIQDELAGFLVSVGSDADSQGTGRVLRADRATILITRLLEGAMDPGDAEGRCASQLSPAALPLSSSRNLASATCGATVTQWSAAPLSASTRPEALVGGGGDNAIWRALGRTEVTIGIALCRTTQATVTSVTLDTTGCQAGDNQGIDVEVLSQAAASESGESLGYGAVPATGLLTIKSDPQVSRQLLLRFVLRGGAPRPVCVRSISVQ